MKNEDAKISLARMYYPVKVLGPGNRVGIWLTGCERRCPGCISPELQAYNYSKEVTVSSVMDMLKRIRSKIDGFTISGGEPFYHPKGLRTLVRELSRISDDILIFTGYRMEELKEKNDPDVDEILRTCAALVDGEFVEKKRSDKGLRGSDNQRIWIMKYKEKYKGVESIERTIQTVVYGDNVLMIGIPKGEEKK